MTRRKSASIGTAVLALIACAACNRPNPADTTSTSPATTSTSLHASDPEITMQIQSRFFRDPIVKGKDVRVTTDQGVVTLSGTVDSEEARRQAVILARDVAGVTRVKDELATGSATQTRAPSASEVRDTAREAVREMTASWITTKLMAQYFMAPEIKSSTIDVTTTDRGVVTLSGTVATETAHQEAVEMARKTDGVARVEDRLRVAAPVESAAQKAKGEEPPPSSSPGRTVAQPIEDSWITTKIQAKYFLDDEISGRTINVDAAKGVVTLTGVVDSEGERRQAVAMARNTDGVVEVRDQLEVRPSSAASARTPGRGTDGGAAQALEDTWITTKIQAKYFLDSLVKTRTIDVATHDGVVTLTGEVQSPTAHDAAVAIARETDGVTRVIDRLTVEAVTPSAP